MDQNGLHDVSNHKVVLVKDQNKNPMCNTKRPFVVSVEGNIGSGKSTMINYFKNFNDIQIHPEPIEKW